MNPDLARIYADVINNQDGLRCTASDSTVDIDRAPVNSADWVHCWDWSPPACDLGRWRSSLSGTATSNYVIGYDTADPIKKYNQNNDLRIFFRDEYDNPIDPITVGTDELKKLMSEFADEIFA